ncbi:MAG TPA: biotin/lipoyl-binding protein, partial [Verrucomicrobiae bacterium]|nr:biotin/lipoyl-binding protein [Verrucomicrobiae bacterium]
MSTDSRDLTPNSHSRAEATAVNSPGAGEPPGTSRPPKAGGGPARPRWLDWRILSVLILAVIAVPVWRLMNNAAKARTVETPAAGAQPVAVAVSRVSREDLYNEVPMPAEFRPYMEVELHAKVSGYVDQMYVDIGDRVKAGQLLATLEVPELRDEHARAMAAEKRAVADYKDAHLVYQRLLAVEKDHPNLVAQQELDAAEARDGTT